MHSTHYVSNCLEMGVYTAQIGWLVCWPVPVCLPLIHAGREGENGSLNTHLRLHLSFTAPSSDISATLHTRTVCLRYLAFDRPGGRVRKLPFSRLSRKKTIRRFLSGGTRQRRKAGFLLMIFTVLQLYCPLSSLPYTIPTKQASLDGGLDGIKTNDGRRKRKKYHPPSLVSLWVWQCSVVVSETGGIHYIRGICSVHCRPVSGYGMVW